MAIFNKKKKESVLISGATNGGGSNQQQLVQQQQLNLSAGAQGVNTSPSLQQSGSFSDRNKQSSPNQQHQQRTLPQPQQQGRVPARNSPEVDQTAPFQHQQPTANIAPANAVLYPWTQRHLTLLPSALLISTDPSHPSSTAPSRGPISLPPFPRYGHSVNPVASSATGDLYIFGGLVSNAVKNDLYILSCAPTSINNGELTVGFVETKGEVPGPRVGHASVGVGNVLIVWGGDTKSRPDDQQDDGLYLLNLSEFGTVLIINGMLSDLLPWSHLNQVQGNGQEFKRWERTLKAAMDMQQRWLDQSSTFLVVNEMMVPF
jgi:hypothetical protein